MACLSAIVYNIWMARNYAFWFKAVLRPDLLSKGVKKEVIIRCQQMINHTWKIEDCLGFPEPFLEGTRDLFDLVLMLKEINSTSVTLVPKTKSPTSVTEFKPIACFNVLYKCISKVLCDRLKQMLPFLIAENQSAFVHSRYIVHNVMVCQDLVRHYGRSGACPSCLIKLDLKKAYDTVEWDFIEEMMQELNFPRHFVKLIMICVISPRFSLMINGSLHGYFQSKRGLRKGDPLSPLLFVLCIEYLSRILKIISLKTDYSFHPRCKAARLTHLCFADDLILCCKGDEDVIKEILQITGFTRGRLPFRYLGVPICSKRISAVECENLIDRMFSKIRTWSSKNLSFAARVTLINSVLLSIQVYWAHIMIIPKAIFDKIKVICRNFLWNGSLHHKACYIALNDICKTKAAGGLGIQDAETWNTAAHGKNVWDIAQKKENLWIRWVNSVYLKGKNWFDYKLQADASWY
ncbi:uncharacterized protein LOC110681676 [Chenopodium quinoa]|uniref:uncharacterized protein LOC110681676 n=1 Tax=Chenopodium quinoa TaxID=63459 RepID=UPI000B773702|nr:uncharacterized protein LOC110681676 [Chenopodium quinoa]